jgi:hypothetical protein
MSNRHARHKELIGFYSRHHADVDADGCEGHAEEAEEERPVEVDEEEDEEECEMESQDEKDDEEPWGAG